MKLKKKNRITIFRALCLSGPLICIWLVKKWITKQALSELLQKIEFNKKVKKYFLVRIKPERSQTATQGVINPARGALWLKLILNPASSKPVFIDCLTPHPPHTTISPPPPSKRSTSITTQPCRARTRGRCGCATIARPGGPSLICAVVGYYYYNSCCCCVFFAFVAIHIRAPVFGCVCRHTPALVLLIMYVSRVFRYNRA